MSPDDLCSFGFLIKKVVYFRDRPVESHHGEPVVIHVENEILAHHCQPDESDVSFCFHELIWLIVDTVALVPGQANPSQSYPPNCSRLSASNMLLRLAHSTSFISLKTLRYTAKTSAGYLLRSAY